MRNPKFGNKFRFIPNTRIHRNLNGELRTYQGVIPTWEGFSVEYETLSQADITILENFLITSVGELITLEDFESRLWTGVITSREITITEGILGCNWTTNFEFEGQVTGTLAAPTSNPPLITGISVSISATSSANFPTYDSGGPILGALMSADSINTLNKTAVNGNTLSYVTDEASSVNLTASGGAIYRATIINGQPAVELNGAFLTNATLYPPNYTAFIVAKRIGSTAQVFSDTANNWNLGWSGANMNQVKAGATILAPTLANDALPHVYVHTNNGFHSRVWKDGVLIADATGSYSPPNGIKLGYAYIGAVGIYAGVLSDGDTADLSAYLMSKFGI